MASLIYADTHVVAWLFAGRVELIPPRARRLLQDREILVSPMVVRWSSSTCSRRDGRPSPRVPCCKPSAAISASALRSGVPRRNRGRCPPDLDPRPFDRIIVAQAALRRAPLITKDATVQRHYERAVWTR